VVFYNKKLTLSDIITYAFDGPDDFKQEANDILINSPLNKDYSIKLVDKADDPILTIKLTERSELDRYHKTKDLYDDGKIIRFSITEQSKIKKPVIYIDKENWTNGVIESGLSIQDYRKYVITHEFMHGLGFDHQPCDSINNINGVCPVMYQSTRGCPKGFKCGHDITPFDYTKKLEYRFIF
jgi:hypothetical protein